MLLESPEPGTNPPHDIVSNQLGLSRIREQQRKKENADEFVRCRGQGKLPSRKDKFSDGMHLP